MEGEGGTGTIGIRRAGEDSVRPAGQVESTEGTRECSRVERKTKWKKIRKRYVSSDHDVSLASQNVIHLLGMV